MNGLSLESCSVQASGDLFMTCIPLSKCNKTGIGITTDAYTLVHVNFQIVGRTYQASFLLVTPVEAKTRRQSGMIEGCRGPQGWRHKNWDSCEAELGSRALCTDSSLSRFHLFDSCPDNVLWTLSVIWKEGWLMARIKPHWAFNAILIYWSGCLADLCFGAALAVFLHRGLLLCYLFT